MFCNVSSFSGELSNFELALDDGWDGETELDFCILSIGVRVLTDSCGDGANGNTVVDFDHFLNRGFHFSIRKTRLMVMKMIEFNNIIDMYINLYDSLQSFCLFILVRISKRTR